MLIRKTLMISAALIALGGCDNLNSNNGGSGGSEASASEQSAAEQMRAALNETPKHGLTKDLFFKGDLKSADESELRDAVMNYASALANGKVNPNEIRDVYTLPRAKTDVKAGFDQALQQNKLGAWLNSLAPQTAEYQALSKAFVQLVERVPNLEGATIQANGKVIKPGGSDPRVPAIAQNLRAQGYLAAAQAAESPQGAQSGSANQNGASNEQAQKQGEQSPARQGQEQGSQGQRQGSQGQGQGSQGQEPTVFTPEMSKALAQWQADAGLKSDGVVGPNTVEQLNAGPRDRARKLAIAMERLRWLEREAPATRIDVNTAASFLRYYREGQQVDERRVVVGEPGWETPQLGSPIFALVANPDWVVPDSIVEEEIQNKSSAWLRKNNFTQKDGRWVQEPGPESALGLVKFAMENDEAIYLHDTPHKALFGQENRHESHGCVRVENAVQFAQMIAQHNGIQPKFQQAMQKDEETQVGLPNKIPVRLLYHTAYLGTDGRVKYAEDVYGWDNDVAAALGYEKREVGRSKEQHRAGDLGP